MTNEEAIKWLTSLQIFFKEDSEQYISLDMAIEALKQPQIIRCKDCKWSDWYTAGDGKKYCYCMETGVGGRTENDYCSYAEREKEE